MIHSVINDEISGKTIENIFKQIDQKLASKKVDVIIGGPPCQPFSVGGNQNGINDSRNGFPFFVDAIKKVKPNVFVFENVRGLLALY